MNKKLLVAAIATATALPMVPMAAQAGVQVYGVVHASIDYVDPRTANDGDSFWNVSSNTSRLGFKGSEDLGNGLKAIWKMEVQYNLTADTYQGNSPGWGAGRNAYIGLAGDWGTFLYGRHDTPYKISTGKLDFFGDRMADYNTTVGFQDVRASDAIAYISPNLSGFTIAAAIVPGVDYPAGNDGLADGYSIAAMYNNNGFFGSLAYEDLKKLTNDDKDKKWRAGLGYFGDSFALAGLYENHDVFSGFTIKRFQVSGSYSFGNNVVKAMWGQEDPDDFGKRSTWAVGADHKLSKRTTAYILYTDANDVDFDDPVASSGRGLHNYKISGRGFSLGAIHKF